MPRVRVRFARTPYVMTECGAQQTLLQQAACRHFQETVRETLLRRANEHGRVVAFFRPATIKPPQVCVGPVSPTDVPTILGVSLLLALVTLGASFLPAYRATKIDPILAIRHQ